MIKKNKLTLSSFVVAVLLGLGTVAAPAMAQGTQETSNEHANAAFNAGAQAYAQGNYAVAVSEWTKAAEAGQMGAAWILGNIYEVGDGVAQSDSKAIKFYEMAAAEGHPGAQTRAGLYYKYGSEGAGLDQDYIRALEYFEAAALQRYAEAQYQLSLMYKDGLGVPKDFPESLRWLLLASNKRHVPTLLTLADIYFEGRGKVAKDPAKGWMYLTLAQENVDPDYAAPVNDMVAKYDIWTAQNKQQSAKANGIAMAKEWDEEEKNPAPPAP